MSNITSASSAKVSMSPIEFFRAEGFGRTGSRAWPGGPGGLKKDPFRPGPAFSGVRYQQRTTLSSRRLTHSDGTRDYR